MEKQESPEWLETVDEAQLFSALAQLHPEAAMFVVDAARQVVYWSEQAEALLGHERADVLGQHCRMISRCQECMVGCPIAEHQEAIDQTSTLYTQGGEPLRLQRVGVALRDEDGGFLGGVEYLFPQHHEPEDISDRAEEDEEDAVTDSSEGFFAPTAPAESLAFLSSGGSSESHDALDGVEDDDDPLYDVLFAYDQEEIEDADFMRLGGLVTRDPGMKKVISTIHRIAETDASVLLQGESGTGKELVARAIHNNSLRKDGPFVAVNCAALTPTLLESELFGHEKGAFTGAVSKRIGLFQRAEGGTIFLDEIAELPLDLQGKLLRVLEEREVVPVGKDAAVKVNIRVVSASYKPLPKLVEVGEFREDLMYRLRVVPIKLPPLRKRPRDIELLAWHFIHLFNGFGHRHITHMAASTLKRLQRHRWPGNIRELKNAIEYAFAVGRDRALLASELPLDLDLESAETAPLAASSLEGVDQVELQEPPMTPEDKEKQKIMEALQSTHGHVGQAAELLGISRPTLWRKRKKYKI